MYLADFDYEILYKTGKEHFVPDLLSRNELEGDLNEEVVCVLEEAVQKIDSETLRKEIKADPVWGKMFRYLSGEDVRAPKRCDPSEFFIDDNILYRVPKVKNENRINYQIVIPHTLVNHSLELSHDSEIAAHSGVLRTLKRSRLHFFWLNQTRDVMNYVKSCLPCQKRKWQGQGTAPLGSFPAVSHPLKRVGVDLIEMTPSYEGNKYILTVIDHFSRYVSAYPLPNKTSQTVTEVMFRFVCDNSVPREVVSDRGTEFNNELFKKVCENLKAKNKFTTSYHPMANGAKEKANSTIKKTLSHLSEEDRFCWDKQVSLTCLAINTSYQSSIKEIPFFIHHGRDSAFLSTILLISYLKLITLKKTMRQRCPYDYLKLSLMSKQCLSAPAIQLLNITIGRLLKRQRKLVLGHSCYLKMRQAGLKLLLAGLLAMSAHTVLLINLITTLKSAVCLLTKGFKQFMPIGLN